MAPTDLPRFKWDIFHPLNHWPWDPVCKTFYGGWRVHVQYWWDYKADSWLDHHVRIVLCRVGRHDWQKYWSRPPGGFPHGGLFPDFDKDEPAGTSCRRCGKKGTTK